MHLPPKHAQTRDLDAGSKTPGPALHESSWSARKIEKSSGSSLGVPRPPKVTPEARVTPIGTLSDFLPLSAARLFAWNGRAYEAASTRLLQNLGIVFENEMTHTPKSKNNRGSDELMFRAFDLTLKTQGALLG